jgi:hypothetical protein
MSPEGRSYKTEIILAIIAGLTAIIGAAIANWDKLKFDRNSDSTKSTTVKPIDSIPPDEFKYYLKSTGFNHFIESAKLLIPQTKDEWELVECTIFKLSKDSAKYIICYLRPDYQYSLKFVDPDSTNIFRCVFYNVKDSVASIDVKSKDGVTIDTPTKIDGILISVPSANWEGTFGALLCQKKK